MTTSIQNNLVKIFNEKIIIAGICTTSALALAAFSYQSIKSADEHPLVERIKTLSGSTSFLLISALAILKTYRKTLSIEKGLLIVGFAHKILKISKCLDEKLQFNGVTNVMKVVKDVAGEVKAILLLTSVLKDLSKFLSKG